MDTVDPTVDLVDHALIRNGRGRRSDSAGVAAFATPGTGWDVQAFVRHVIG
ncbi:hypothetical protein [Nocardia sp. NPDC049707]|uniref:hypothetical protein n=1 Tax=Nocardia sp. NPDC049707 TaxID=3154735 RepID=UPI0034147671